MNRLPPGRHSVPKGWEPLVKNLLDELEAVEGWKHEYISQVKDKFAGLRFYYDCQHLDEVEEIVQKYEEMSCTTCEDCGSTSTQFTSNGWVRTLCKECKQ